VPIVLEGQMLRTNTADVDRSLSAVSEDKIRIVSGRLRVGEFRFADAALNRRTLFFHAGPFLGETRFRVTCFLAVLMAVNLIQDSAEWVSFRGFAPNGQALQLRLAGPFIPPPAIIEKGRAASAKVARLSGQKRKELNFRWCSARNAR